MRRTFNFTSRKRIDSSAATFSLAADPGGRRYFNAAIDLSGIELPLQARVYVEAYHGRSAARFSFGTVGEVHAPDDRWLDELEFADRLTFRVKVVDETGIHGRILALLDGVDVHLSEEEVGGRRPLLPVSYTPHLGDEVWRLRFTPTGPLLEVNSTVPGITAVVESDRLFAALVRPQALRSILERILIVEELSLDDAGFSSWHARWLLFAQLHQTAPLDALAERDEKLEWIDACVAEFARRTDLRRNLVAALSPED